MYFILFNFMFDIESSVFEDTTLSFNQNSSVCLYSILFPRLEYQSKDYTTNERQEQRNETYVYPLIPHELVWHSDVNE